MFFLILILMTAALTLGSMINAYRRTKDTFHPLMFLMPMAFVLYVLLPLKLTLNGTLSNYFTEDQQLFVQFINLIGVSCLAAGCVVGENRKTSLKLEATHLTATARRKILHGAYILGGIGLSAYLLGITNVGGFSQAYGQAYSSGWSDYGYIRDAVAWCGIAVVFILLAHIDEPLSKDKQVILYSVCLAFASPFIIQGLLGARRGPTFQILVLLGMSWYMMRRARPRFVVLLTTGILVGSFLLFLVSNRGNIYLGSDFSFENAKLEYFEVDNTQNPVGNEYIYGGGAMLSTDANDSYYWGRRYFAVLFLRPIPRQLFPDKYEYFGVSEILQNLGVGTDSFQRSLGWVGAEGSAPGIVADMWIEFWWGSMVLLFGIGWCYGRAWRLAVSDNLFYMVLYTLLASLSLFLVFQTLEALLYRFLFSIIPAWLMWQLIGVRKRAVLRQLPIGRQTAV